jgi:hypothetical protein
MFKGIRIWGVLAGFITDIVFSLFIGVMFAIGISIFFAFKDRGDTSLIQTDSAAAFTSVWLRFLGGLLACFGSFMGGFIASWVGSEARMKNVLCVMILELSFDLILLPFTYIPPLWLTLVGIPAGITSIYMGGLLAKKIL